MELQLYKSVWTCHGDTTQAIQLAQTEGLHGIEGPAPLDPPSQRELGARLGDRGLDYIAEVTTGGSYVPDRRATLQQHLDDFARKLEASLTLQPRFVTSLAGCDAWAEGESVEFFGRAMALAAAAGVTVSFETHRSRSLFNPWTTLRIARQLPDLLLTCDFSHWCVVCERLMDTELEVIEAIAPQAHHIHARVGYDQGPQVPHPAAPEYAYALRAHQQWWETLWRAQRARGMAVTTLTPEFGPDGYLQARPFSQEPVAELGEVNGWMAAEERRHYSEFVHGPGAGGSGGEGATSI